jgi:hypothetical protein
MAEVFVPIIFFFVVGGIIASFVLTRHKERMTMLDRGLSPEDIKQLYDRSTGKSNPYSSLKWGIVFVSIGLAVIAGMVIREFTYVQEGIYPALIALFGGAGLIVYYLTVRKKMTV